MSGPPADAAPATPSPEDSQPSAGGAGQRTTGRSVLRGGAWNSVALFLPQVYTLLFSIVAARMLGPDDMGRLNFIAFVELTAVALFTAALPEAVMRSVGEEDGRRRPERIRYLSILSWRLTGFAAGAGAVSLTLLGLSRGELRTAWLLAAVAAALMMLQTTPSSVLIGLQQWRAVSTVSLCTGPLGVGSGVAVLLAGGGIAGVFAVEVVVTGVNLLWTWRLARRALRVLSGGPAVADPELRRSTLYYARMSSLQVIVGLVVWRRTELIFLERSGTPADIAVYSIAFAASTALSRLPEAVATTLAPAMASLVGSEERERLKRGFARALRLMLLITTVLTVLSIALGPLALSIAYGSQYDRAGAVLVLLILPLPLQAVSTVGFTLLFAQGEWRLPLLATSAAAVIDVVLAAALVPPYGPQGAAVANAVAVVFVSVPLLVEAVRRTGPLDWALGRAARLLLASAATAVIGAAVASWVGGILGLTLGTLIAFALTGAAALMLRCLVPDDAAWAADALGGRLGRAVGSVAGRGR